MVTAMGITVMEAMEDMEAMGAMEDMEAMGAITEGIKATSDH